jgi:hypothetical protein
MKVHYYNNLSRFREITIFRLLQFCILWYFKLNSDPKPDPNPYSNPNPNLNPNPFPNPKPNPNPKSLKIVTPPKT